MRISNSQFEDQICHSVLEILLFLMRELETKWFIIELSNDFGLRFSNETCHCSLRETKTHL